MTVPSNFKNLVNALNEAFKSFHDLNLEKTDLKDYYFFVSLFEDVVEFKLGYIKFRIQATVLPYQRVVKVTTFMFERTNVVADDFVLKTLPELNVEIINSGFKYQADGALYPYYLKEFASIHVDKLFEYLVKNKLA